MRIGILGGSFDPVHQGHLIIAEQCREAARLDQVWWLPCATQPLKESRPRASDRQRVEMLELAIAGHPEFSVCRLELDRGGTSFAVDTLEQLQQEHAGDQLFWIMGDDSLETFSQWKSPARFCQLATPVVAARPGSGEVDLSVLQPWLDDACFSTEDLVVVPTAIDISSSNLRDRIQAGRSIRYLTPRSVERYIQSAGLYLPPANDN